MADPSTDLRSSSRDGLPRCDIPARLGRVANALDGPGLGALIISAPTNIRYLCGFTGSAGTLVVAGNSAWLVTDGRYTVQARRQLESAGFDLDDASAAAGCGLRIGTDANELIGELLAEATGANQLVGLEADHITWSRALAASAGWGRTIEPTSGLVEGLREVKDDAEVARIELACRIADDALSSLLDTIVPGVTERDLALRLDDEMRERGSDGPSFETIVASGPNSALPHARPTERALQTGDSLVIDFGATVEGYHSDMTRSMLVGGGTPQLRDIWDVVASAQRAGCAAVRAGVPAATVDATCRSLITDAGFGECFSHGTGHGVGLDIHEAPRVAASSTATLAAGHVVTVEPGIYVEGLGGVRIEDSLHIVADGADALTKAPIVMTSG